MPRSPLLRLAAVPLLLVLGIHPTARGQQSTSARDAFEARVRPVLIASCVRCHGASKSEGGLRLDSRTAALAGGDSGPAVVPGDPDASLLIEAVRRDGLAMPPDRSLPPDAVAAMVEWVRQGAPWPESPAVGAGSNASSPPNPADHWAFRPLNDPSPPDVADPSWARDPIDRFILQGLDAAGLTPAPEANRRTLIRRLAFDLVGLPPSPEEVAAFVDDDRPDAYERLVDRLLASPQLGERWARHWLDVARYADTKGYVLFEAPDYPWAWTYRDYVVRAFNTDLPYDRFLTEQLAADLLPGADGKTLAALGFLTVGGRFMGNAHDVIDDRIDVTMRGFAGLTVACARCHDHKFDPISQADYYGLYGVFASTEEPMVPPLLDPPPKTAEYEAFARELDGRVEALRTFLRQKHEAVRAAARLRLAEYLHAAQAAAGQPLIDDFMLIADGNDLNPAVLARWRSFLDRTRRTPGPVLVLWHELARVASEDFAAASRDLAARLKSGSADAPDVNPALASAFLADPPETIKDLADLYAEQIRMASAVQSDWERRMRLDGTPGRPFPRPDLAELAALTDGSEAPANLPFLESDALALLPDRPSQAKFSELRQAVETFRAAGPHAPPRAMAVNDRKVLLASAIFKRGNPSNPGPTVQRRAPILLTSEIERPFTHDSGRLELARTLTGPASHLSARVIVNRVWMHHMGTPLVATPADFGLRSESPTHGALLDHLATSLIRDGWSLKSLHRRIVLSQTYRQSSGGSPKALLRDPENHLLGRANRHRLEFETLRDSLLAVSGRLDPTLGGPPRPDAVAQDNRRRTLYTRIDRLNPAGVARSFDVPDPNALSPARAATVVAPQALFLLNHPFVRQAAAALRDGLPPDSDINTRLDSLYGRILGRPPRDDERAAAHAFLAATPTRDAWQDYVQALLMTNEFAIVD